MKTMRNNPPSKNVYEQAHDWESSKLSRIEQSERRAWNVAIGAASLAGVLVLAIVFMMPLKETVPYVIRVDNNTGVTDILTTLKSEKITYNDAIDKAWLVKYVRMREGYDWYMLQEDYDSLGVFTPDSLTSEYARIFDDKKSLEKIYGNHTRVTTRIISIVPNGKGNATVRLQKTVKRNDSKVPEQQTNWVATIAYEYRNPSTMLEKLRIINPLALQVLSYRLDPELVDVVKSNNVAVPEVTIVPAITDNKGE